MHSIALSAATPYPMMLVFMWYMIVWGWVSYS